MKTNGRSIKFVNRLKKLYRHANSLTKIAKFPLIKKWVEKQVRNDELIYLTKDKVIEINQEVEKPEDMILPSKIVEYFINKSNYHWIMNFCICREGADCKNYPKDLGCLFMGEAVLNINPKIGRLVSKEEALQHVNACREAGLVHTIGRNKLDSFWLGVGPENKLLTVCNCCECCCITQHVAKLGAKVRKVAHKMPGVVVKTTDKCKGCGLCQSVCIFNAIELIDEKAQINEECRGCGRCVDICPQKAIALTIEDEQSIQKSIGRIDELVDVI